MEKKNVLGFRVDNDTYSQLTKLSEEKGVTISSVARNALLDGLKDKQYTRDAILIETLLILRSSVATGDDKFWNDIKAIKQNHLQKFYNNQ